MTMEDVKILSPSRQVGALNEIDYNCRPRQSLLNGYIEEEFCTRSNVEECLCYLDKELQMVGLQSLYNQGSFDLSTLVNVAYKLLKKYQQSSRYREELELRVHRSVTDLEHCQGTQKKLRQSNKTLQNTIGKHEETERQLRLERSAMQQKVKVLQDEVRRLNSLAQSNDKQYRHESKKRERQMEVLKERAQQLLSDKTKSVPTIEISDCLTRSDGRRSQWRNESASSRNEEDMYRGVLANFEKRCADLHSENTQLRGLLTDVQQELLELSAANKRTSSPRKHNHTKEQLQLPIDMIHDRLGESLRLVCSQLKTCITAQGEENILDTTFTVHAEDEPSMVEDANISVLEEQEKLSKERSLFYNQKAEFEQEKLDLTESTLKLHKERKRLEELKRSLLATPSELAEAKSPKANRTPGRSNREQHITQIKLAVKERTSGAASTDTS